MNDILGKVLLAVVAALLAVCATVGTMVGWHVVNLTEKVETLTEAAHDLELAVESNAQRLRWEQDQTP